MWWQFLTSSGVAMATFCYECVAEWKSEETCIFADIGLILLKFGTGYIFGV